ncbi:hypothetical protein BH09SUM1_BH09SUM1_06820 [soil metagenome]
MTPVRLLRKIDSENLNLPELKPFIGREIQITLSEPDDAEKYFHAPEVDSSPEERRKLFGEAATGMDFEAYKQMRKKSLL